MVRKILGVIIGYFAIFLFVVASLTAAYLLMGTETAYEPDSYEVSMIWIIVSGILGFFGAIFGGYVCNLIAQDGKTSLALAGLLLVLGLLMAFFVMTAEPKNEVRRGDVPNFEAMQKSQQPVWVAFMNPLIGALGVYLGGNLRKGKGN